MKKSLSHSMTLSLAAAMALCGASALAQQAGGTSAASPTAPAASVGTSPAVPANGSANSSATGSRSVAAADMKFMKTAAQGGVAEVQSGEMALSQGSSTQVKNFGQQMVADHGKANQELMTLASAKGVQLPTDTDAKHKKAMASLKSNSGASFDKAYAAQMVKDHEETLALFRKAAGSAQDADVKAFAAKTVPTLEHHLQMAQQLQASVK